MARAGFAGAGGALANRSTAAHGMLRNEKRTRVPPRHVAGTAETGRLSSVYQFNDVTPSQDMMEDWRNGEPSNSH